MLQVLEIVPAASRSDGQLDELHSGWHRTVFTQEYIYLNVQLGFHVKTWKRNKEASTVPRCPDLFWELTKTSKIQCILIMAQEVCFSSPHPLWTDWWLNGAIWICIYVVYGVDKQKEKINLPRRNTSKTPGLEEGKKHRARTMAENHALLLPLELLLAHYLSIADLSLVPKSFFSRYTLKRPLLFNLCYREPPKLSTFDVSSVRPHSRY